MISYELYCRIKHLHQIEGLTAVQIAKACSLDQRTVAHWLRQQNFSPRQQTPRSSILDPYKEGINQWLEKHPDLSAVQILNRLQQSGYKGGYNVVKRYVRIVRPKRKAYLTLSFAPGEAAQVDWGTFGTIKCGSTRRKLSFFVMVLCHCRMMYVEFTVRETMEHFLGCHQNAFEYFGAVPEKVIIDNLKTGVLRHLCGEAPVFNQRYLDFANHYGFRIIACNVRSGNEKGRVENGVGYVKKNFLRGLELADFSAIHPAARSWLEQTANVRIHGETKKKPSESFPVEKAAMQALSHSPYDIATVHTLRANSRFRIHFDANRYSVPAKFAGSRLLVKTYPDRLCIYSDNQLVARHLRSYDRHQDFEDPDHPKPLLEQRQRARDQKLYARFLELNPNAEKYYLELQQRRLNPKHHIRKILACSEIYGNNPVARAIDDALEFQVFGSQYIENILEQQLRILPEPKALTLTRAQDALEITLPEPNLGVYK